MAVVEKLLHLATCTFLQSGESRGRQLSANNLTSLYANLTHQIRHRPMMSAFGYVKFHFRAGRRLRERLVFLGLWLLRVGQD